MASVIDDVPCPECGENATETINHRRNTVTVTCSHCGFSARPQDPETKEVCDVGCL